MDFTPFKDDEWLPKKRARVFLLPALMTPDGKSAGEGNRGVVLASNGLLFDLAGGCTGCITVYPYVGQKFLITKNNTSSRSKKVIIAGLHSHSVTYFHTLHELFPRLYMIMDYVKASGYNTSISTMLMIVRSPLPTLNSMNEMMGWPFTPSLKVRHKGYVGSFATQRAGLFVEGFEHIIIGSKIDKGPWYELIKGAKMCIFRDLMKYKEPETTKKCEPKVLPEKYILVITREGERGRTLLNSSVMIDFLKSSFDLPVILPKLKYGCR